MAPLDVRLEERDGQLVWTYQPVEESMQERVRRLVEDGETSPSVIAEELNITKGYASKLVRKVKAMAGATV